MTRAKKRTRDDHPREVGTLSTRRRPPDTTTTPLKRRDFTALNTKSPDNPRERRGSRAGG